MRRDKIFIDFESNPDFLLAHGCNTIGRMGAGFAKMLKGRYPDVYLAYVKHCLGSELRPTPGDIFFKDRVFNMFTQRFYGNMGRAKLEWVQTCVNGIDSVVNDQVILAPRIGCGLGGLEWNDVREILAASKNEWRIYALDQKHVEVL